MTETVAANDGAPTAQQRFASALRTARERAGLTQAELAELLGKHFTTISTWERSNGGEPPEPPREMVFAMEELFKLAPGTLSRHLGYFPLAAVRRPGPVSLEEVLDSLTITEHQKRLVHALIEDWLQ